MKCPKCGSTNIATERRPDGNSTCVICKHTDKTQAFRTGPETAADVSFEKFANQPTDWDDPYWQLFEVKDVMNTVILRAVEYGYKKGFAQAEQEITLVDHTKWEYVKTFISKMNGWANFRAFLEREIK